MRKIFVPMLFILSACATKPVALDLQQKSGQWKTKALIRDIKNSKSNTLSIDFVAIKPDLLRAEVSATLGLSVASLAINKNKVTYAIHTQKKFYQGVISDQSMGPLLQVKMNPRVLFYVLFDQPLPASAWNCRLSGDGLPETCESKNSDFKILWTERNGETKRVTIQRAEFEIQVYVKSFSPDLPTKVQEDPSFFTITPPNSYKSYQLN
jgi:hypothetical protein